MKMDSNDSNNHERVVANPDTAPVSATMERQRFKSYWCAYIVTEPPAYLLLITLKKKFCKSNQSGS